MCHQALLAGCGIITKLIEMSYIGMVALGLQPLYFFRACLKRFQTAYILKNEFQNATGIRKSTPNPISGVVFMMKVWALEGQPYASLCSNMVLSSVCSGLMTTSDGPSRLDPVHFSDESRLCVDFTDRRARVWKMRNEQFSSVCIAEHDHYSRGSVMMWMGISVQWKTDLYIMKNGMLTTAR